MAYNSEYSQNQNNGQDQFYGQNNSQNNGQNEFYNQQNKQNQQNQQNSNQNYNQPPPLPPPDYNTTPTPSAPSYQPANVPVNDGFPKQFQAPQQEPYQFQNNSTITEQNQQPWSLDNFSNRQSFIKKVYSAFKTVWIQKKPHFDCFWKKS